MSRGTPSVIACGNATSLMEGGFGIAAKFAAKVQSFWARQRPHPRGGCQSRQALTGGVFSVKKGFRKVRRLS